MGNSVFSPPLSIPLPLHNLHFRRRNNCSSVALGQRRQIYSRDAPSAMAQHPPERRMPCYVTDQLDRRRVKARLDGHRMTFFRGDHRFEREIVINRLPATFMHIARCGATCAS